MKLLGGKLAVPAIAIVSMALLVSAVSLGLRVGDARFLLPFPNLGRLDYSAGPPGGFARLDDRVVAQLLGENGGAASGANFPVRQATTSLDAPATVDGIQRSAPVHVRHAFTNDHFANAYRVPSVPFTADTDTGSATAEPEEPASCGTLGGKTAWYALTMSRDAGILANTFGTDSATALSVYTGTSFKDLARVDCSSDARGNALVAFPAKAGTTYYFQVDRPLGGRTVFTVQEQGVTTRASVDSDGQEGNGGSLLGIISKDGKGVAMASGASNFDERGNPPLCAPAKVLLPCGKVGLYVRDRARHRTVNKYPQQSLASAGSAVGSLAIPGTTSADGRYLAFWASVNVHPPGTDSPSPSSPYRFEAFRHDDHDGTVDLVSVPYPGGGDVANGSSARAEISDDGRFVAFVSWAGNLVPGDTNGVRDIFVRDMRDGVTTRVNVPSDADLAALGPPLGDASKDGDRGSDIFSISGDGRYVVFRSSAPNLVKNDTNRHTDVFVRDRVAGTTTRVNVSSAGEEANAGTRSVLGLGLRTISDDGRYVFFNSDATNLVAPATADNVENVYRRDLWTGRTTIVTVSSTGERARAGVQARDPRRFAFTVVAPLLIAGGPDASLTGMSYSATRDGRYVVFSSDDDDLVPGDDNGFTDVFLRDIATGTTTRISVSSTGAEAIGGPSGSPTISGDGRFVAFDSSATNLVDDDDNDNDDVFVRELPGPLPFSGWY